MTFYELLGMMLARAADSMPGGDRPVAERPTELHIRQIALFLRRMSALWRELFVCLWEENAVLEACLTDIAPLLRDSNIVMPTYWLMPTDTVDPLTQYRKLIEVLGEVMTLAHERRSEQWARDARRRLQRALAESARIQGRLVDLALTA